MTPDEEIAHRYLERLQLGEIQLEPDGNVTPDFLVDKRIAVEVRRLNQNWRDGERPEGLEETFFPLRAKMSKLLASLGRPLLG